MLCRYSLSALSSSSTFYSDLFPSLAGEVNPCGSKIASVFFIVLVMHNPLPSALKDFAGFHFLRVVVSFLLGNFRKHLESPISGLLFPYLVYLVFQLQTQDVYVCEKEIRHLHLGVWEEVSVFKVPL